MKQKFSIRTLSILAALGLGLFMPADANAQAVITVTTTADEIAEDSQCSLREAIIAANTDAPLGGCPAGEGADTITFASSLPQPATITLSLEGLREEDAATGDLDIHGQLTIIGLGQSQTVIDGNGIDRVFDVRPEAELTMSSLAIQNGDPGVNMNGGGIYTVGKLTLENVSVLSNHGGGIFNNSGEVTLTNVTIKDSQDGYGITNMNNGTLTVTGGEVSNNQNGGIYNTESTTTMTEVKVLNNTLAGGVANVGATKSSLSMTSCIVASNSSSENGGGITNDGPESVMEIHTATVSSNLAVSAGGGIYNSGNLSIDGSTITHNQSGTGGGIDHFDGSLSLTNVTISGNVASVSGGGLFSRNNATLANVTLADNHASGPGTGGNIFTYAASLTVRNTIVTGADANGNCFNNENTLVSQGYNLDSGNTCGFTNSKDLTDTDPILGALQDNGGPTFTHALLDGSPAIDQGNNSGCPKTDQRGYARPADGNADSSKICDIGAYELNGAPPVFTATPTATEGAPATETSTPDLTIIATSVPTDTPTVTPTDIPPTPTASGPIPPCPGAAIVVVALLLLSSLRPR